MKYAIGKSIHCLGLFVLAAAMPFAQAGADEPATPPLPSNVDSPGIIVNYAADPAFTVRANALYWHRQHPGSNPVFDSIGVRPSDFDFGYKMGWEVSSLWQLNCDRSIEARYFQIDHWQAGVGPIPINENGDPLTLKYKSTLRNAELNSRREVDGWLTTVVGFRYLNINEEFGANVQFEEGSFAGQVKTQNNLYGLQIGADAVLWSRGRLAVNATGRAGLFFNDAERNTVIKITGDPTTFQDTVHDDHLAFVGELGLTGEYRVNKSLTLRAGYQFLWVEGVALASDQLVPSEGLASPNVKFGGVFYHGAMVGAELKW